MIGNNQVNEMEFKKINLGYSLKNIPVPSNEAYLKSMINKLEDFITRLRWKVFFLEKDSEDEMIKSKGNFGFKTCKVPPPNNDLKAFENDLYDMVRSIEFKNPALPCNFQKQLRKDIKTIKSSNKVIVPADKTNNLYEVSKEKYNTLLSHNVTAKYKKADPKIIKTINLEAKKIASSMNLEDRIEQIANRKAFITLKDHKENFINDPKCRLINPAKSNIGKISKVILDRINTDIRNKTLLNQWRNTEEVLKWFNNIENKHECKFFKLDIVEFYPSISESLMHTALNFAKEHTPISEEETQIILHSRQSVLFDLNNNPWIKKGNSTFDVTMGSYDGAEVCELVGLLILHKLKNIFTEGSIGLYRDDGLAYLHKVSPSATEKLSKKVCKVLKNLGLKITTEAHLYHTNFLDVTLNLRNGNHSPYNKPNNEIIYINAHSNHPPHIIKQLPSMIENRVSKLCSNKNQFENSRSVYEDALSKAGYKNKSKLNYSTNQSVNKCRSRKIIWFNPPFNMNVKTNVGKVFLNLLDKHFNNNHKFHKICNRNNIKISYSCMPNVESIITNHNKKIMKTNSNQPEPCNCRNKINCPLQSKCQDKCIIYQANVTIKSESNMRHTNMAPNDQNQTTDSPSTTTPHTNSKVYYGSCETNFKTRYNNHIYSFNHRKRASSTTLSKHYWKCKDLGQEPVIKWKRLKSAIPYQCGGSKCDLCLTEKLTILQANGLNTLNHRSEILNKCRHKNKFKLCNIKN